MSTIQGMISLWIGVLVFCTEIGYSLRMEVNPQPFNQLIHPEVDVTCIADGSFAESVVVLQIQRPGEKPIATIDGVHGLIMGSQAPTNAKADGHLDKQASGSYLAVTFSNPQVADTGIYECVMLYLNEAYQVKEIRTNINVTMDNEDLANIVRHFVGEIKDQGRMITTLTGKIKALRAANAKQNVRIEETEKQISLVKAQAAYQCAFTVKYNQKNRITQGKTVVFSDTVMNIGNAYDVSTGVFTAPKNGLYVFNLVVTGYFSGGEVAIHLKKNDEIIASLYAQDKDYYDQSTVSLAVSMNQGDQFEPHVATISGISGANLINNIFSVFSGYLLSLS